PRQQSDIFTMLERRIEEFQFGQKSFGNLRDFGQLCIVLHDIGINVANIGINVEKARQFITQDVGELSKYNLFQVQAATQRVKKAAKASSGISIKKDDVPRDLEGKATELYNLVFIPEQGSSQSGSRSE